MNKCINTFLRSSLFLLFSVFFSLGNAQVKTLIVTKTSANPRPLSFREGSKIKLKLLGEEKKIYSKIHKIEDTYFVVGNIEASLENIEYIVAQRKLQAKLSSYALIGGCFFSIIYLANGNYSGSFFSNTFLVRALTISLGGGVSKLFSNRKYRKGKANYRIIQR